MNFQLIDQLVSGQVGICQDGDIFHFRIKMVALCQTCILARQAMHYQFIYGNIINLQTHATQEALPPFYRYIKLGSG